MASGTVLLEHHADKSSGTISIGLWRFHAFGGRGIESGPNDQFCKRVQNVKP
jgi:hypothetical protein